MMLAAKLVLVPLLIAAITVAGARFGPRVAGMLTGLPVVAGPIVLFLALEQGAAFAARSATATLAGEGSLAMFCLLYAWAALATPWWLSLTVGWTGFAAATLALDRVALSLPVAAGIALAAPVVLSGLAPRPVVARATAVVTGVEIALRMAASVVLVLALTALAHVLGPHRSGLLTVFPIATTILAVFSHRAEGGVFAVQLLRGLALGLYSLTAFFLTLALTLERLGIGAAFPLAAAAALAVQGALLAAVARK